MICFEVLVNGDNVCTAGVSEPGTLNMGLNWGPWRDEGSKETVQQARLYVAGREGEEHLLWVGPGDAQKVRLTVGDEVTVRILENGEVDEPQRVHIDPRPRGFWRRLLGM